LSWNVDEPVAIPVSSAFLLVRNSANAVIPSSVLPTDPARSRQIMQNRESASAPAFTLHFTASVPAFGFSFFSVGAAELPPAPSPPSGAGSEDPLVVANEYLSLTFSRETKLLSSVTDLQRNVTLSCSQQLLYYEAEGHLLFDFKHKRWVGHFFLSASLILNQLWRLRILAPQQLPGGV
jgi:hypothetical protein